MIDINRELKAYGLSLNHKKSSINELPISLSECWTHQINEKSIYFQKFKEYVDYKELLSFLDFCILLMNKNEDNAAIINYGLKILSNYNLTKNAQRLLKKTTVSLSLIYPYIVPLLGEYIFAKYDASNDELNSYFNMIYDQYIDKNNFEACSYAIYYAINHNVQIKHIDVEEIIKKNDCVLLLITAIYMSINSKHQSLYRLIEYAKELIENDYMEEYWVFIFECLTESDLKDKWKEYKNVGISFLKEEYKIQQVTVSE